MNQVSMLQSQCRPFPADLRLVRSPDLPMLLPSHWYNAPADLPFPLEPPLHPQTHQPLPAEALEAFFAPELVRQETSTERWIEIPEAVRDVYATWRPTPLVRARRLERKLQTPAEIYYKYEGSSAVGSHKLNTALAQAWSNHLAGTRTLVTETGAGQWGSALALAGRLFDLEVLVFMVAISARQKPQRLQLMRTLGADVTPSPSDRTAFGREILARDPDCPGSLGMAISEALETVTGNPRARYALGSVLNHVLLHQTVIGLEARAQLEALDRWPDTIVACHGGGSNFGGIALPFLPERLAGTGPRMIAVEPASCPSLTRGRYGYDAADTAGLTPLLKMYSLGKDFMPPSTHAGGLRYHGSSPIVSALLAHGLIEATAVEELEALQAARLFLECEALVPAPESSHAIAQVIREAIQAREEGTSRVIVFNLSGHGLYDLSFFEG